MTQPAAELQWTGQTRQAVAASVQTLAEMGDAPWAAHEALSGTGVVRFDTTEAAEAALDEMRYLTDMGHPGVHEPTLRRKVQALETELGGGER